MFIQAKIQDGLQQQLDFRCGECFFSENSYLIVGVNCKNYLLKSTYLFISKGVFLFSKRINMLRHHNLEGVSQEIRLIESSLFVVVFPTSHFSVIACAISWR